MHKPLSKGMGIAAVWMGLSAAAQAADPHPPSLPDATIELPRPVTWFKPSPFGSGGLDWYVAPGTYRAVLEDDQGVYYVGPSPCAWASNATPDLSKRGGQAWLCGILMPKSRQEEPRMMVVHAGFWQQLAYLPDGSPDRDQIGEAKNGAPAAGTPPEQVIKGAKFSTGEVTGAVVAKGAGMAAQGAVLAGASGAVAGGIGGLIGFAIVGAIENAKRGNFEDIRNPPPAGWYKASGAVWHRHGTPALVASTPQPAASAASGTAAGDPPQAAAPQPAPAPVTVSAPLTAEAPAESTTAGRKVTERPANARTLTAAELDGHAWRFAHPSNPANFGEVRISFRDGQATARNARSGSSGPYSVVDDKLCIRFESSGWGTPCYYLLDGSAEGPGPTVLVVANGRTRPLTVE